MTTALAGTRDLVRLAARRDRVMLPVWVGMFVVMAAFSAAATVGLLPTVESRVQLAASSNNTPALVALYGRVYDPTSLGAVSMLKMGGIGSALVAVLAIITVVRHTRAEEESGRLDLVGATVVGRLAPLTAALLVVGAANLVLALATAIGLVAAGLPLAGSFAFGLAWAGVGIAFAAIAAVTAQLASSGRGANGAAIAILGAVYVVRAVGDTAAPDGPRWLSWLSPLGWGQQFRPYAGDRWWVLLITVGFAAVTTAAAYALAARRDVGAGLLPDRPGASTAGPTLGGPLGLAWRLHRGVLYAWLAGFVLFGFVMGNIASNVGTLVDSPQARDFFAKLGGAKGLTDAFLASELSIFGLIASAYGISAALRLRSEETALHAEPVLATAVGRVRFAASHATVALAGTALLLLAGGLGAGLGNAAHTGDAGSIGRILAGALVQIPAAWVLTALVLAAFGLAPRLVVVGWAALVAFLLLGQLGPLLELKQWLMDLSPYTHVPKLPGSAFTAVPLVWLLVIAAVLTAAGLAGFRRRDVG
jgi:ABC-2 type transport system permease protein